MSWLQQAGTRGVAGAFAIGVVTGVVLTGSAVSGLQRGSAATRGEASAVDVLLAKDQIREQLYTYGRGLDRMDREMALSPYHTDATVGGVFTGTAAGWIDSARRTLERETASSHQMTNMLIRVNGDKASSETYFIVSQHAAQDAGAANAPHTSLIRGRYIDTWERRSGKWGIAHREIVIDFGTNDLTPAPFRSAGKRDASDPSYKFFK